MSNPKQLLPFLMVGTLASVLILSRSAMAEFRPGLLTSPTALASQSDAHQFSVEAATESGPRAKDDDWYDDDPVIQISGRVVRFGERDENEWILEANGRRYRVDAGPRWWRDLPVAIGDQLTVEGEFDDGEVDALWVKLANGETVEIRARSGPPDWAQNRRPGY